MKKTLRLFSWNVNGLRAVLRKGALQSFLEKEKPDVLCLQEIKCKPAQLDMLELDALKDYEVFWNPAEKPGYSGTAVLVRCSSEPNSSLEAAEENSRVSQGGHEGEQSMAGVARLRPLGRGEERSDDSALRAERLDDERNTPEFSIAKENLFGELALKEGRVLTLEFDNFFLVNVYTPNSKPDLSRLELREKTWDPEFKSYLKELEKKKPVITCGDFNAAHEEIDLARPKTNHKNAGFTDEERKGVSNLLAAGFIDSFRFLNPEAKRYTWWSHWGKARENNVGWRIDYFFLSESLEKNLKSAEIYESYLGSDHCPISAELELGEEN
ncbi:exodeoxyribonuclease III [Candidatus Saccharibacteria bacterium]|nr:exodeoxyribonuclease III [Candidatus Saccharibacteria bacterium]